MEGLERRIPGSSFNGAARPDGSDPVVPLMWLPAAPAIEGGFADGAVSLLERP